MRKNVPLVWSTGVLLWCHTLCIAQQGSPLPRLHKAVDRTSVVALPSTVLPSVKLSEDLGRLSAGEDAGRMVLVLAPDPAQEQQFSTLLDGLQNRTSPHYHQWLTAEQTAAYGVASADVSKVSAWLSGSGLTVEDASRSGRFITFSGKIAQVESTFGTEIHRYSRNGKTFVANRSPVLLPEALVPVVTGVASLSSSIPHSDARVVGSLTLDLAKHDITFGGSETHALVPGDFATIYNLRPLFAAGINGTGQAIAIIGRTTSPLTDITNFRSLFKLPPNAPQVIINGIAPSNAGDDYTETVLDTEWAGATAPMAKVIFVSSPSLFNDGIEPSTVYAIDNNLAGVLSLSYSSCEQASAANDAFFLSAWRQAAAEGISVMVSSGDSGGANCDSPSASSAFYGLAVSGLSSTPYNTSVGGTQFLDAANGGQYWSLLNQPDYTSVLSYIPETVWNESSNDPNNASLSGGGGGASTLYSKPPWQTGPGVPADGMRDLPDVSLNAAGHDGYVICDGSCGGTSPTLSIVGGTSASSPSMAGIMALVDQKLGGRQGVANWMLYSLATSHPEAFHDIVVGSNKVPDGNGNSTVGYNAGPGYDLASGLGSFDATLLVNDWFAAQNQPIPAVTLTGTPGTIVHGTPLAVTVRVSATAGRPMPTGQVSFLADTLGIANAPLDSTGTASFSLSDIPGGAHSLTARYAGDGTYAEAVSNALAVTVTKENSVAFFNTIYQNATLLYGDPLNGMLLGASAASGQGFPTGSMSVNEGSVLLATGALTAFDKGQGSTAVSIYSYLGAQHPFGAGPHTLVASYTGDASFNPSSTDGTASPPLNFTVTKVNCTANFNTSASSTFIVGLPGTLKTFIRLASFPNSPYSGTITIQDVTNPNNIVTLASGPVVIVNNYAGYTVTFPAAGTRIFTMNYSGDSNVYPCITQGSINVLAGAPTTTTLTKSSTGTIASGTPLTLTANVATTLSVGAIGGNVTFLDGTTVLGTAPLPASGPATLTVLPSSLGNNSLTAVYGGSSLYTGSSSAAVTQAVSGYTFSSTPAALTVQSGISTGVALAIVPYAGFMSSVGLACGTLPANMTCIFAPGSVTPDGVSTSLSTLTISTGTAGRAANFSPAFRSGSIFARMGLVSLLLGLPLLVRHRRRPLARLTAFLLVLGGLNALQGCSSTMVPPAPPAINPLNTAPGTYLISLSSSAAGSAAETTTLSITVTQ